MIFVRGGQERLTTIFLLWSHAQTNMFGYVVYKISIFSMIFLRVQYSWIYCYHKDYLMYLSDNKHYCDSSFKILTKKLEPSTSTNL